jgi:hypothetical protein
MVNDHFRSLIETKEKKCEYLTRFLKRFNSEAQLPSCCACGITTYPVFSGTEHRLSRPRANEDCDDPRSFYTYSMSDPVLNPLKVTEEQRREHASSRHVRSVVEYHLHSHLLLPSDDAGPEPAFILFSACSSKLKAKEPSIPREACFPH